MVFVAYGCVQEHVDGRPKWDFRKAFGDYWVNPSHESEKVAREHAEHLVLFISSNATESRLLERVVDRLLAKDMDIWWFLLKFLESGPYEDVITGIFDSLQPKFVVKV